MLKKRYFLDSENLLYRRVRLSFSEKTKRFFLAFLVSMLLSVLYGFCFKYFLGSPKEKKLDAQVEELKFRYSLLEKEFNKIDTDLADIAASEDNMYRPVLDMATLSESFRQSGYGGTRKYDELEGYMNSDILVLTTRHINEIIRKTYVQSRSFEEIIPEAEDWKNKLEHIPYIQPVRVNIPLGEGIKYRDVHPVLGDSRWHYGQDFSALVGTEVFATGSGVVKKASWTPHGFGNRIEIDHGYGFTTIYGHLSEFNAKPGQEVRRGDLIGKSGSTGISSGPHLHYEIHYNGTVQNPLYFFSDDLTLEEYNRMIESMLTDTLK